VSGHKCTQLFVTDLGYVKLIPMKLKSEAGENLQEFIRDVGIPKHIHTDGAKELTGCKWNQIFKDCNIKTMQTEPDLPWQNKAEIEIREIKHHVRQLMGRSNTPKCLWDI